MPASPRQFPPAFALAHAVSIRKVAGIGVPGGHDFVGQAAPPAVATQPCLHEDYARQRLLVLIGQKKALRIALPGRLGWRFAWTGLRFYTAESCSLSPYRCNCWNSIAVMFELRCSEFELRCSDSQRALSRMSMRGSGRWHLDRLALARFSRPLSVSVAALSARLYAADGRSADLSGKPA